ncbi:MAG: M56 family metallopeptidase, partial [Peptococcaceae bacterium]|nr:M56 family metallopeptidase [Peptococcaceae bacterium]
LTHYKHHDLWYKLILLCANALHWFNPFVWLMNRQAGRDVEQVCDDYVVDGKDMEYRKAYSMTILNTMAIQKGVALSTHLSKDAQNTKKRFAGILEPKTYKKGITVFAAVLILVLGISGCLQIGKVDEGVALYNRVAEYLPENAIHEPDVYEVWGVEEYDGISYQNGEGNVEKKESDFISYLWAEDLYEVTEEEFNQAGSLAGYRGWHKDEGYFLSKRSLIITILKETGDITSITYGNTEEKIEPVKPSEIGRNKEQRDAYVHQIAADLLANGDTLVFREALTDTDENGNATLGYYVCGTEADPNQYVILIDYTEGTLKMLRWIRYDAELREGVTRWRDFTFMLEGMEETVQLELNRQSGYYAMYTDSSIFHRVPQEFNVEGAFLDKYLRRVEPNIVQCYIQVGYEPNMTIGEWLDEVETDRDYEKYLPQTNPWALYEGLEWAPTGNYKVFPNEPDRQWREYITISGAYNVCYLTPYRDGVMIVQISHPFGAEDFEGMGSRMAQMIDTLVLATE